MLLIPCPHCGPRAQVEFTYGGDATVERPPAADDHAPGAAADEDWLQHIYERDNPRGEHLEWWHHVAGCRRWIRVKRDTATHEISGFGAAHGALSEWSLSTLETSEP